MIQNLDFKNKTKNFPDSMKRLCEILNVNIDILEGIVECEELTLAEMQEEEYLYDRILCWVQGCGVSDDICSSICEHYLCGGYASLLEMYEHAQRIGSLAGYKSGMFGIDFPKLIPVLAQLAMWVVTFGYTD